MPEPRECSCGELPKHLAAQFACHAAPEVFGKQWDLLGAVAQRRDGNDVECQPVEEIAAKAATFGKRRKVDIGRGNDADIDVVHLVAADALEAVVFDDTQDLLLHGERGGGNLAGW